VKILIKTICPDFLSVLSFIIFWTMVKGDKMSIRGIVFDIGGVLEYTEPMTVDDHWENELGLEQGLILNRMIETWKGGSIGTVTLEDVHQKLAETCGMSARQIHDYMEEIWIAYLGTLNQEIYNYFKRLRPKYKTAILSNSFVGAREREESAYNFSEICDFIIYSHEVGMQKPDPAIYALTCERLALQPVEVIFLDDREDLVVAAKACGMQGVVFRNNAQAIAEIEARLAATS
jgi:epoxide hydrolase-like predicted phosphatase